MPSPFQSALLALIEAERECKELEQCDPSPHHMTNVTIADRRLAQAGDVLESELRKMMRDELETAEMWRGEP